MLKRIPKELDPEHPYADDLRMKSFTAGSRLTHAQVTSSSFDADLATTYRKAGPFTAFLCRAIDLPF